MLRKLLSFLVIFLILAVLSLYVILTPPYDTQLHFQHSQINITRERYAIPHIYAPNRRSFLYGWGYALAQDRLFQISFRRLYTEGRLSQFLGARTFQSDIMMRDLSFAEIATNIAKKIRAENKTIFQDLQAFSQGINDQVANRLALPLQFYLLGIKWEPWSLQATLLLYKLLQWTLSHNMIEQYARSSLLVNHSIDQINKMIPNTKETWAFTSLNTIKDEEISDHLKSTDFIINNLFEPLQIQKIVQLGMPQFIISAEGSNAWAVRGEHTESGKPILSGDPHLDSAFPSHWYQIKATYSAGNKTIQFAGVAPPGVIIAYGKTDYLASAMTVIQTDTQDLFLQKLDGSKYLVDGEWKSLRVRNQTIRIKEGGKLKQYNHTVKFTHRGPILSYIVSQYGTFELSQPLSLAWTGFNQEYRTIFNLGVYCLQVDNFEDLQKTLVYDTTYFYSLSIIFATADNHIIYQQTGVNPIRKNYTSGSYVKNGSSSKDDWIGFIPAGQSMNVFDPECGYLVTSNNRVGSSQFRAGYYNHMVYTARADRISQVLEQEIASGRKISNQFAVNLLYDTVDVYCRQILPQIMEISPKARQLLSQFDCNFKPDSYHATIYEVFMFELWHLIKPLQTRNMSLLAIHHFQQSIFNAIHDAFKGDMQKQANIHSAWDLAHKRLTQFFKTTQIKKWRWGLFHRDISTQLPLGNHPLFSYFYKRQSEGWGNLHTPNVGKSNKIQLGNFATSHRANMRSIFDFGGSSWWVLDGGASQNMLTEHYDDQWKLFVAEKLIPLWEEGNSDLQEL